LPRRLDRILWSSVVPSGRQVVRATALVLLMVASIFVANSSLPLPEVNASPDVRYSDPTDGVVTGSGGINTGASHFWVGDEQDPPNVPLQAFVKFSLSGISGTLASARLYLYVAFSDHDAVSDSSSPLTNPGLGDCLVRHIGDYGTLGPSDFNAPSIGSDPGVLIAGTATPNVGYTSIDTTAAMQDDINHGRAFTTFLIKLSTDTDYDGKIDRLFFGASEAGATEAPYIDYRLSLGPPPSVLVGLTEWSLPTGRSPAGISAESGRIWYASGNGVIGQIDPPTNTFTEWAVQAGGAQNPACLRVFGDTIYFTDRAGNKIGKLTSNRDQVSTATVPTSDSGPNGITFSYIFIDSPTSLTFTEEWQRKIGRLQLGGMIFDLLLPAPRSSATQTPTFNLVASEIHVVTPTVTPGNPHLPPPIASATPVASGPFTEWSLSPFMADSRPMTVIPDETSYWFSTYRNYLGRLVSGDRVYIFGLPTASSSTIDLKVDTTGNIWYTAGNFFPGTSRDIIGKLEPGTGTVTEWIVPTTGGTPSSLAIDKSGMIWFTQYHGNKIGKLDPTTYTFYEFPMPILNSRPLRLSIDPNGNIWFTEEGINKVGGLSPAGQMIPEFPENIFVIIIVASAAILVTLSNRLKKQPSAARKILHKENIRR